MSKRLATEEEKKEALNETLSEIIDGEHGLSHSLERRLPLTISDEDYETLLTRMMKTPKQIEVFELLQDIIFKPVMANYLSERQKLLQSAVEPVINVAFKHFRAPTLGDGGWEKCKAINPQNKVWAPYFDNYKDYIIESERNAKNLRLARERNMPIDIVITTAWDEQALKPEDREPQLIRFVIFEPLAENQRGFQGYVTPVVTKK